MSEITNLDYLGSLSYNWMKANVQNFTKNG